jgi:hypothetical protein
MIKIILIISILEIILLKAFKKILLYINQQINLIMITNLTKYSLKNKFINHLNKLINKYQLKDSKFYKILRIKLIKH